MPPTHANAPGSEDRPEDRPADRVESETDLVQTYLAPLAAGSAGAFGLRDDAALISPEPGTDLVVSSDPIIAGVHFFIDDAPEDVAWKALAVNASDMAAKGARPLAYILTLALPDAPTRAWMTRFSDGLRSAQESFGCRLIGGDTDRTPGPLSIGITIFGAVPAGKFVPRLGAAAGDHVFVTGTIGDAALGLAVRRDASAFEGVLSDDERAFVLGRYLRPKPRLALAETLRNHASAALDISDGLMKDLARLAGPSGISLGLGSVPMSPAVGAALAHDAAVAKTVLTGGDDYELLVAVPPAAIADFKIGAERAGIAISRLGVLEAGRKFEIRDQHGTLIDGQQLGYDHFSR
ncbi:thiamine-phosphate kinase [Hyphomicrobium facile]|uniref:Thiamine-monophosphate kinase n=1 Tax=Hyphomicrobium facile TaxID=51670 RepID=A0A1I7NF59_9HYPH|nr:thiamine-phosphate kinase [Hyphomicrobium facile]SFV33317.1 thiamine-phosphate kinase [Hyphomicrobium facile]